MKSGQQLVGNLLFQYLVTFGILLIFAEKLSYGLSFCNYFFHNNFAI